jgi:hypothetical protein
VKVVWTEQALVRLGEKDHIWVDNPAAAVAHTERLLDRAEALTDAGARCPSAPRR